MKRLPPCLSDLIVNLSSFSLLSCVTGDFFGLLQYFLSSGIYCLSARKKKIVEKVEEAAATLLIVLVQFDSTSGSAASASGSGGSSSARPRILID